LKTHLAVSEVVPSMNPMPSEEVSA